MSSLLHEGKRKLGHRMALAVGFLFCGMLARAQPVILDFEGLGDQEPIDNFYNGGFGGLGSGPGPNYGVTFTYSQSLISLANGGSGDFANNPSGFTIGYIPLSAPGGSDTMDVAGGFGTGFSLYYATAFGGSVNVYSGLDGTGSLLATLNLSPTPLGVYPTTYNTWAPAGVSFSGTAESVVISDTDNYLGFDNITLGSATPLLSLPDHTSFAAESMAAALLVFVSCRVRKSAA